MKLNEIWNKISNTKSMLGLASAILLILTTVGVDVDSEQFMLIVRAILFIFVTLGILNNNGMDTPKWNK